MLEPGSITVREAVHRGTDPASGASIIQLTSAPAVHSNIYCEVPYFDPSSRWVIYTRTASSHHTLQVWRADLERTWLTPVCEGVIGISGMAMSPDHRYFHCVREAGEGSFEVLRTEIATLKQRSFMFEGAPRPRSMGSLAPDNRTYIYSTTFATDRYGIVRCDLEDETWQVVHEGADICNAHPQIEPGRGDDYMIQHNRGCEFDRQGRCLRLTGDEGATIYLISRDGGDYRPLPVGLPHTWRCQGHQCWIGTTGEILLTVSGDSSRAMMKRGNLLALRPGDERARVVAGGHVYCHPNASRDGRFFVSDTRDGVLIVVGSIKTGRSRVLCPSRSSLSSPQYTHPHPYFSPDCRWVIFNSDATGIPHVHAARVPDGLLESLDRG